MIVADASALINALLQDGEARSALAGQAIVVPHAADAEVAAMLRSAAARGELSAERAYRALDSWMVFGCERLAITGLLPRVWALRHNVGAYDAAYVVLAEALECELLTADKRLARSTGPTCEFAIARN